MCINTYIYIYLSIYIYIYIHECAGLGARNAASHRDFAMSPQYVLVLWKWNITVSVILCKTSTKIVQKISEAWLATFPRTFPECAGLGARSAASHSWALLLQGQKGGGGSPGKVGSFSLVLLSPAIGQVRHGRGRKGKNKCWKQSLALWSVFLSLVWLVISLLLSFSGGSTPPERKTLGDIIYLSISLSLSLSLYMYIYIYIYIHTCKYIYVYVCIYIYIYIYIFFLDRDFAIS